MVTFSPAPQPDVQARAAVETALLATSRGLGLGNLAQPALWLAACQGQAAAQPVQQARVIVFASGNAIAAHQFQGAGLSALVPEATHEQAKEIADNIGPIHTAARRAEASVRLVQQRAIGGAIDSVDGLTVDELDQALALGVRVADEEADSGADLLLPADISVANSTIAAAVMGTLARIEPVAIVGPGSGLTDAMWKTKVSVIRDAMFRARKVSGDPIKLLQCIGNPDLAAQTALIAHSAVRRTPILLGGCLSAVAAVLAERLSPGTAQWCFAADATAEPAHRQALRELDLSPLVNLNIRANAVGALAVLPLIRTSIELVGDEVASILSGQC
ncbi:MAG: nicotinate-nucleotide--dimethylbenzimidazole phosphoribosyltransferase [Corynebacterium sp.]|nr:nicotinate-nucleotide--dimethylbenzimidazole phosphoribosyltransferase [Corynebacterium sp.]